jgi:hypothetical protein
LRQRIRSFEHSCQGSHPASYTLHLLNDRIHTQESAYDFSNMKAKKSTAMKLLRLYEKQASQCRSEKLYAHCALSQLKRWALIRSCRSVILNENDVSTQQEHNHGTANCADGSTNADVFGVNAVLNVGLHLTEDLIELGYVGDALEILRECAELEDISFENSSKLCKRICELLLFLHDYLKFRQMTDFDLSNLHSRTSSVGDWVNDEVIYNSSISLWNREELISDRHKNSLIRFLASQGSSHLPAIFSTLPSSIENMAKSISTESTFSASRLMSSSPSIISHTDFEGSESCENDFERDEESLLGPININVNIASLLPEGLNRLQNVLQENKQSSEVMGLSYSIVIELLELMSMFQERMKFYSNAILSLQEAERLSSERMGSKSFLNLSINLQIIALQLTVGNSYKASDDLNMCQHYYEEAYSLASDVSTRLMAIENENKIIYEKLSKRCAEMLAVSQQQLYSILRTHTSSNSKATEVKKLKLPDIHWNTWSLSTVGTSSLSSQQKAVMGKKKLKALLQTL